MHSDVPASLKITNRCDPLAPCGIIKQMATHAFQTDDARLHPIKDKVLGGERLNEADALTLYGTGDILAIGWLANWVRERFHGNTAYFNVNRHINPTNVCIAACRLCAFGRKKDAPGAYTMALEEAFQIAASGYTEAITEFHIVGGLHPDLPLQYFLDLVSGLKERFPQVHMKAFTMVEVAYLAKRAKLSIRDTLVKMKEAGVDSLPGGGAEIFADRVRHIICDHKIDGDQWLDTARLAHEIGLKSNATMLYGHIENDEDRVDHLLKLRALQDDRVYQNVGELARLQSAVTESMKRFEYTLRRRAEGNDQVLLSGSDDVPEQFRKLVDQYYKALSKGPEKK